MHVMGKLLIFILISVMPLSALAEFRIWRDQNGNSIEAELLTLNATQVAIRDRDGKVFKFSPKKLSKADQTYLKTAFPPEMEMEFDKIQVQNKSGISTYVTTTCEIVITKKEKRAYKKPLKTVLMIICECQQSGDYAILDRAEATFDFKNSREFNFRGNTFTTLSSIHTIGYKYEGYIAVIMDDQGKVLEVKSNRKEFKKQYALLLTFEKLARFSKDFRKSDLQAHLF